MPRTEVDPEVEAERVRHVRALVEELLVEHDVCGQVILAGRNGRLENFSEVRASWSRARLIDDGHGHTGLGLRSRAIADYQGDKDKQRQELEWTLSMISGFAVIGAQVAMSWLEASKVFDAKTGAEHTPLRRDDPRDEGGSK